MNDVYNYSSSKFPTISKEQAIAELFPSGKQPSAGKASKDELSSSFSTFLKEGDSSHDLKPKVTSVEVDDKEEGVDSNEATYLHYELDSNGLPRLIDGNKFDLKLFANSAKECYANAKFKSALDKQEFLLKVCKAFGLSTELISRSSPDEAMEDLSLAADTLASGTDIEEEVLFSPSDKDEIVDE